MKLSLVIPCYNEAKNIPLILEQFNKCINNLNIDVVLVDNGSFDNTSVVLDELIPKYSFAKRIEVDINQGYGFGILSGLKVCDGDYVGWTHADMQTDPADVIKAYNIIVNENRNDLFIKGNRKGRPIFDEFFTLGMGIFETIFFGTSMFDINAQPNIFPRSFYENWCNPPYDFSLDLYAFYMAKHKGLKIIRFDVDFPKRIYGTSKWNTGLKSKINFINRTLDYSFKLKKEFGQ